MQKKTEGLRGPAAVAWLSLAVLLLLTGCASAAETAAIGSNTTFPAPVAPAEISSVELVGSAAGESLEVRADHPLVWTQYRNDQGELIIELPNTTTEIGAMPASGGELISFVRLETETSAERPMTRLVISTLEESNHVLEAESGLLTVRFEPLFGQAPVEVAVAEPASLANRETEVTGAPVATVERATATTFGTADSPALGPDPAGVTASVLDSIEVRDGADGLVVELRGDGEFVYSSFLLEDPPRFVVDLDGVVKLDSRAIVPVGAPALERIRMAQFRSAPDPVARVVLDLIQEEAPAIERRGDALLVRLGGGLEPTPNGTFSGSLASDRSDPADADSSVATPDPAPAIADVATPSPSSANEPSPTKETMAADSMATDSMGLDAQSAPSSPSSASVASVEVVPVSQSGSAGSGSGTPESALELPPSAAEAGAQVAQTLPAPQMPEIVLRESAPEPESDAPLEIRMEGDIEQRAEPPTSDVALYEAQEVRITGATQAPQIESAASPAFGVQNLSPEQRFVGEPVTLSLRNADINEVLRSFAREFDLNIVIQPGVGGPVTVELDSVPWEQALDAILKTQNLGMELEGNIVRIAPVSRLQQEAQDRQRLAQARALSVPLTTIMKRVSYARASELARILTTGLRSGSSFGGAGGGFGGATQTGILSQRGSVSVDDRTNTLIIRELPDYLDTVVQIIENLDVPEKQVMIEARIVETTRNFSRTLGVNWSFNGVASAATGNTTGLQFPNNIDANGGVSLLTGGQNGFLNIGLGNVLNTFQLDIALQAAENDGLVNVISAPKVATLNNERASIQTGLQIPIQTVANNTVSVQFVNATLRLNVTPHVTAEGTILMDIQIQKREPQLAFAVVGATNAPIATREASTRVIVRDGGTAVIGGIYQVSSNYGEDKVPGLANIPILGHLFRNKNRSNQNEELLIFITPRVIQL